MFFTQESAVAIRDGKKTRTTRFWLTQRAKVGRTYKAQLNRSPMSVFAVIKVTHVRQWKGEALGHEHAVKEGFENIDAFWELYNALNKNKTSLKDKRRRHFIIDFEVVEHREPVPPLPKSIER